MYSHRHLARPLLLTDAAPPATLTQKKRGFGIGKYNGFGGKVEAGETTREAASRELLEESNLFAAPELLREWFANPTTSLPPGSPHAAVTK